MFISIISDTDSTDDDGDTDDDIPQEIVQFIKHEIDESDESDSKIQLTTQIQLQQPQSDKPSEAAPLMQYETDSSSGNYYYIPLIVSFCYSVILTH